MSSARWDVVHRSGSRRSRLRHVALLATVTVAVSGMLGGSSVAAARKRVSVVLELTRTTGGPSSFELSLVLSYNAKGGEGFIGEMGGRRSASGFAYVEPGFVSSAGR